MTPITSPTKQDFLATALLSPGKITLVNVSVSAAGVPTFQPNNIPSLGNAFVITDSPIPLYVQCPGPSVNRTYLPNTGEAFPFTTGNIVIGPMPGFSLAPAGGGGSYTFKVKVWTGGSRAIGFIDHRNGTEPTFQEFVYTFAAGTGLFSVASGSTVAVTGDQLTPANFLGNACISGILIGNNSPSYPLYLMNGGNNAYEATIFPQTTARIPYNQTMMGAVPTVYFGNPSGVAIPTTLGWIIRQSNYGYTYAP